MRKLWISRRGVSSMIGGIIILTLFLSALSVMVFISQQYDSYQSTVETVNRNDINAFSENLVPTYPGLTFNSSQTVNSGTCQPYCYSYILYVSNNAAIGTNVTRIYINSTDTRPYSPGAAGQGIGCGNLCAFDPSGTPQPFHFLGSSAFVNPSEYGHQLIFYTNNTYELPCSTACGAYGVNSIAIVTSRGRVFSFQWPIPPSGISTVSYLTTGVMQIAYQGSGNPGYSSANEPAAISAPGGGSGGTPLAGTYCHLESNATKVISGSYYSTLWFVNPWVTMTIFNDAFPASGSNHTSFYVAVKVTNNQGGPIVITRGNMWLQLVVPQAGQPGLARVLTLGGPMVGTYYSGVFTPAGSQTTVASTYSVLLIYKINIWSWAGTSSPVPSGVTYSGVATVTNDQESGSPAYFSGTSVIDGLYVKSGC